MGADRVRALELYAEGAGAGRAQDFARAVRLLDQAIALDPGLAEAHADKGAALRALGQPDAALACYERAIAIRPGYAEAWNNRGNVLRDLGRTAEAAASYGKAIGVRPDYLRAWLNRAGLHEQLNQAEAALDDYDGALRIRANDASLWNSRGNLQWKLGRAQDALESYRRALSLDPGLVEAHVNCAILLTSYGRARDAVASCDAALRLRPDYAEAWRQRGNALYMLADYSGASEAFERAGALDPRLPYLLGTRLHTRMQMCDWQDYDATLAMIAEGAGRGEPVSGPATAHAILESAALQRRVAEHWGMDKFPPDSSLPALVAGSDGPRIRVGYFSADFHQHPVAALTAGLYEAHDRTRFEVHAFSFGPDSQDPMRQRLMRAFDRFHDVRLRSDVEIALLARRLGIDIAVDLGGFTDGCRPRILSLRAAPVQLSYIGYLGTMAVPYIDYLVADETIIPAELRRHYTEKILYLPSFQVNDPQRPVAQRVFTRAELGLPEKGFVFCCFNGNYKITPQAFDRWMRILGRVPDSVLWLFGGSEAAQRNLRMEADRRGVDPGRLVFAGRLPYAEHLARTGVAGLFLDTTPYNAGTTASDVLWMGVPVVTCPGETFPARMGASLLRATGLPELVAATPGEYEDLAVGLAMNPDRLDDIRRRLAGSRSASRLFDTVGFTRNLEAAFERIHARRLAGLPPEHVLPGDIRI